MSEKFDVVVIGAGLSGLGAALGAEREGRSVLVLEASNRVGGIVSTTAVNGFLVEQGPNSFAASEESMQIIRDVGLRDSIRLPSPSAKKRFVVRNGTLHSLPQSPPAFLASSLLSARGKLRVLAEPFVSRGTGGEESLATLVRRRLGSEVLEYLVDPFVSGVYAGNPDRLSSRYAMRMLYDLEQQHGSILRGAMKSARARRANSQSSAQTSGPAHGQILTFKDGLATLPHAVAAQLKGEVRSCAVATKVARNRSDFEITYRSGGELTTVSSSRLVVAVPAHALRSISWPDAWAESIQTLADVPHAAVATVAFGFPRANVAHPLDGFGMLIPYAEKRDILGALFNSTLFEARAPDAQVLITVFIGGARANPLPSNEHVVAAALRELQSLLGVSAAPTMSLLTRWEPGIPQFVLGHDTVLAAAESLERTLPGLVLTGSYLRGVSVGDCIANGLAAGKRAART